MDFCFKFLLVDVDAIDLTCCVCCVSAVCLPFVCLLSVLCLRFVCFLSACCLRFVCALSACCLPFVCLLSAFGLAQTIGGLVVLVGWFCWLAVWVGCVGWLCGLVVWVGCVGCVGCVFYKHWGTLPFRRSACRIGGGRGLSEP